MLTEILHAMPIGSNVLTVTSSVLLPTRFPVYGMTVSALLQLPGEYKRLKQTAEYKINWGEELRGICFDSSSCRLYTVEIRESYCLVLYEVSSGTLKQLDTMDLEGEAGQPRVDSQAQEIYIPRAGRRGVSVVRCNGTELGKHTTLASVGDCGALAMKSPYMLCVCETEKTSVSYLNVADDTVERFYIHVDSFQPDVTKLPSLLSAPAPGKDIPRPRSTLSSYDILPPIPKLTDDKGMKLLAYPNIDSCKALKTDKPRNIAVLGDIVMLSYKDVFGPAITLHKDGLSKSCQHITWPQGLKAVSPLSTDGLSRFFVCDGESRAVFVLDINGELCDRVRSATARLETGNCGWDVATGTSSSCHCRDTIH